MALDLAAQSWKWYAFVFGMLGWGIPVGLATYAVDVWFLDKEGGLAKLLIHLGSFMFGGILYGLGVKWWGDRKRAASPKA